MTDQRACIRGCFVRGEHFAECSDYGTTDGECKGCVPSMARDGALVCNRCFYRVRRHLDDAPDLVAHLRSIADPTKAKQFKLVMSSSSREGLPAPVDADLIDASTDIVATLRAWAESFAPVRAYRLTPGADAVEVFTAAHEYAAVILEHHDAFANHVEYADLATALLQRHGREPEWWSVADAMVRWPLIESPHYAAEPCPECDLKMVWVTPARRVGMREKYLCQSCDWESDDHDENGLWRHLYSEDLLTVEELIE